MKTNDLIRKIRVVRERPSRVADFLREPRPIVIGGHISNRLGLQIARATKDRLAWKVRASRVEPSIATDFETIDRDGVLVVPDFLPPDAFSQVRREIQDAFAVNGPARIRGTKFGENYVSDEIWVGDYTRAFPSICAYVRDNERVNRLAAAVSRRTMTFKSHVSIQRVSKPNPNAGHTDYDYNQFVHADRHYPFVKIFYYVNDVDSGTAPYSYAIGSHKVTAARLAYEYQYSLRYVKARRAAHERSLEQLELDTELRALAEAYLNKIGARLKPIVAPANTLIVSNNQGFHARGPMLGKSPRLTINLDFKYLESPAQWMFPVLKHLYR